VQVGRKGHRSLHATPLLCEAVMAAEIRALVADMLLVEHANLSDYMHFMVFSSCPLVLSDSSRWLNSWWTQFFSHSTLHVHGC
jgi:hypothetical protein